MLLVFALRVSCSVIMHIITLKYEQLKRKRNKCKYSSCGEKRMFMFVHRAEIDHFEYVY